MHAQPLVCFGLSIWLWRQTRPWPVFGLAIVIGGATGNIFDRVIWGAVADFFDFQLLTDFDSLNELNEHQLNN